MEPPQTLSHLLFAFKSTCYHEDIQTHVGAHPEGQVIWYPWSKGGGGGGGGGLYSTTDPANFGGPLKRFPLSCS